VTQYGWSGLDIAGTAVLDRIVVNNAGQQGAAIIARQPITLTNSTISNCSTWGLKKPATDTTDYTQTNTFTNVVSGNVGDLP